jgi:CheY-like chemotaxis protein
LAISASDRSADRVATLRAGVDDYLAKPFDVEELLLRADRLLGSRGAIPSVMEGDLASQPPWELVQFIQQAGKSGELAVHGSWGAGQLTVRDGRVVSARWKKLRGPDALLALLELGEGRYRLTTGEVTEEPEPGADAFSIPEVLMKFAWIQDELAKHRDFLPATGEPLRALVSEPPAVAEELRSLPIGKIFDRIRSHPGVRLYDLIEQAKGTAPPRVRLAVAWLVEQGAVRPEGRASQVLDTAEISSTLVLDLAVGKLLSAAAAAGFEIASLPYLLLAEPGVRSDLMALLTSEHARVPELRQLAEQMELRQGGSAEFRTEPGSLSLHVQILGPGVKAQVEGVVTVCAGVLVWLDGAADGADPELLAAVIRRLEGVDGPVSGVLVAGDPAVRKRAEALVAGSRRWWVTPNPPRSLIGVLRLLHPRVEAEALG